MFMIIKPNSTPPLVPNSPLLQRPAGFADAGGAGDRTLARGAPCVEAARYQGSIT